MLGITPTGTEHYRAMPAARHGELAATGRSTMEVPPRRPLIPGQPAWRVPGSAATQGGIPRRTVRHRRGSDDSDPARRPVESAATNRTVPPIPATALLRSLFPPLPP